MYTPRAKISSTQTRILPVSLENFNKINPEFKPNDQKTCSHVVGDTPQSVAKDSKKNRYCLAHSKHMASISAFV